MKNTVSSWTSSTFWNIWRNWLKKRLSMNMGQYLFECWWSFFFSTWLVSQPVKVGRISMAVFVVWSVENADFWNRIQSRKRSPSWWSNCFTRWKVFIRVVRNFLSFQCEGRWALSLPDCCSSFGAILLLANNCSPLQIFPMVLNVFVFLAQRFPMHVKH